jgi:hypothetical protein
VERCEYVSALKFPRLIRFLLTTFRGFLGHLDESV